MITTIQRVFSVLKGEPSYEEELEERSAFDGTEGLLGDVPRVEYNPLLPPEYFDVVVIDECHRSIYSTWRQVLDYFDSGDRA